MVDLEKAFDSVCIDGLVLKMHYLGINVWSLIRNFLKERKFLIRIDGVKSAEFRSTVGPPQGSVLSPTMFDIFVYDMCCNLVGKNFKYADDLTLLTYGPDSVLALNAMQDDIEYLTKWLNDWKIQASLTKTKAMTFKKKTVETVNEESLTFGDLKVEFVESVKDLGVLIDDKLTFSQQFAAATSKALQTFGHVTRSYLNNQSMSPNTFQVLYQAIVIPQWTYLAFIWGERGMFLKSQLWSEIVSLSTCSLYHPK